MSFPGPEQVAGWGAAQQPAPAARSKTPVIVLAVLAGLFAVAAGVFTVLYFGEQAEADRVAAAVVEKQSEVDAAREELAKAEDDAQTALDELESQESRKSDLESEKDDIEACNAAAKKYLDLGDSVGEAERDAAFDAMFEACRNI